MDILRKEFQKSLSLQLYSNAQFLAERLMAEEESLENLYLLSKCFFESGNIEKCYHFLKHFQHLWSSGARSSQDPPSYSYQRKLVYMFSMSCIKLQKYEEGETHLFSLLASSTSQHSQPHQTEPEEFAVFYWLGIIHRYTGRPERSIGFFLKVLELNSLMWSAYENLCQLGFNVNSSALFFPISQTTQQNVSSSSLQFESKSLFQQLQHQSSTSLTTTSTPSQTPIKDSVNPPPDNNDSYNLRSTLHKSSDAFKTPKLMSTSTLPSGNLSSSNIAHNVGAGGSSSSSTTTTPMQSSFDKNIIGDAEILSGTLHLPEQTPETFIGSSSLRHQQPPLVPMKKKKAEPFYQQHKKTKKKLSTVEDNEMKFQEGPTIEERMNVDNDDIPLSYETIPPSSNQDPSTFPSYGSSLRNQPKETLDVSSNPNSLQLNLQRIIQLLATACLKANQFELKEALKYFSMLPNSHYNTGWVLSNVGRCYFEMNNYYDAEKTFDKLLEIEPYRLEALEIYSTVLWHQKKEKKLSWLVQHATDINPMSPFTFTVQGNYYSLLKEHKTALKCFQNASRANPFFSYAFTLSGHECFANDSLDEAMNCYRKALTIDLRHYNAWYGLGKVYLRQQKHPQAEYHFTRALNINPKSPILYSYLAMTLHSNNQLNEALKMINSALQLDPLNPMAKFKKAKILLSMENKEEALQELESLLEIEPKEAAIYTLMGNIYTQMEEKEKALYAFNMALDLEGPQKDSNESIKTAMTKLLDGEGVEA